MALRDWQRALGQLVQARSSGRDLQPVKDSLAGLELGDAERRWLHEVTESRGFALTSQVPRWWRETRVRRSARLTLRALGAEAEVWLSDYIREVPCFTLFFVAEGMSFFQWLDARPVSVHVRAVARFERAMWRLRQTPFQPSVEPLDEALGGSLARHPAAELITFDAAPEAVLGALLVGAVPPEASPGEHVVLVAPGLPRAWRPATAEEARAFRACESAMKASELLSLSNVPLDTVKGLLAAQAFARASV